MPGVLILEVKDIHLLLVIAKRVLMHKLGLSFSCTFIVVLDGYIEYAVIVSNEDRLLK